MRFSLTRPTRVLRIIYKRISNRTLLKMIAKLGLYLGILVVIQALFIKSITVAFVLTVGIFFASQGSEWIHIFLSTCRRDAKTLYGLLRFRLLQMKNVKHNLTIPRLFEEVVRLNPRKVALQCESVEWSFKDLSDYSNAVGNHFHDEGFGHGDTFAIFVENRPEFVALWLGLSKIGITSALINFNLRNDALVHCINVAQCKAVIFSASLRSAIEEVQSQLRPDIKYFVVCEDHDSDVEIVSSGDNCSNIDEIFRTGSRLPPPYPEAASYFDKLLYIYTSGTTGLPKAAKISHCRFYYMAKMMNLMMNYTDRDKIYCALPLYHSNGGIVGLGQVICAGVSMCIRTKFSASRFWTECKKYDCTVILYIGEICRYLLAQPERMSDKDHNIRMATGNGLRPGIWAEFVKRFNIGRVAEFYGATEGNSNLLNIENVQGSCGFISVIAPKVYPVSLLKINEDNELIRDENGLCVKCKPDEVGMLVGKIITNSATQRFEGYVDEKATAKKMAYDVFQKGDCVFMSGDVLVMDKYGNMYFRDRTGDTFRWKGENVSTAECEAELAKVLHNQHTVAVFGVQIPNTEGRAGMACVMDPDRVVDMDEFHVGVNKLLTNYARPIFVRLTDVIETTGTHKVTKSRLKKEGFDISQLTDPVYFLEKDGYRRLDNDTYQRILSGDIRL